MIRNLLATTAIATLLATGAYAQTTAPATTTDPAAAPATAPATDAAPVDAPETPGPEPVAGHLATNIIGENVYNGVADDAETIGTVNDIVIGRDNEAALVIIGVGGFLGLGEKDVAIEYPEIEWAQREDGTTWLVVSASREELEQQEEFDRDLYDPDDAEGMAATDAAGGAATTTDSAAAPAADDAATDDTAAAPAPAADDAATDTDSIAAAPADDAADDAATDDAATDDMAAAPADDAADDATTDTAAAPAADDAAATDDTATAAIDRSTLTEVDAAGLSAEDLIGTSVYGADEENVGSIEDVILDGDAVDFVTLEVGGFLGMGDKEVAVDMENLAFMSDEDGEMYLYTSFTKEQLEAQPAYDEATFADTRDEQLLINPAN